MKGIIITGSLSALFLLVSPLLPRGHVRLPRTEAIMNAKQIGLALLDFDADYGCYPDATTIAEVKRQTSTSLRLGDASSNEIFRQLIATGSSTSEKIFWAQSAISPRKPDDIMHGAEALKKGEVAFAYVAGLGSASDPATPLLMAPVDPVRRCFERSSRYEDRAVILFCDGSARHFPIDKHGRVWINGMDLFDPRQTFWKGKPPDIKWPE
jgi:hypothetical protein